MGTEFTVLETEKNNKNTINIDRVSTYDMLKMINQEDKQVALVVEENLNDIEVVVENVVDTFHKDGRVIYVGAGTSGRLGILDASECPPTFGVSDSKVQALIAGGTDAIFKAREGAEDSEKLGKDDLNSINITEDDMVIGIAASGRTPYVIGALKFANKIGAKTASISCVSNSKLSEIALHPIEVITGPEVIAGSTRMKAGTAQKMILNMISTSAMIKIGKVYKNYMVDVKATNEKLANRAQHLISEICSVDSLKAKELFEKADGNVKIAILIETLGIEKEQARQLIESNNGKLSNIID